MTVSGTLNARRSLGAAIVLGLSVAARAEDLPKIVHDWPAYNGPEGTCADPSRTPLLDDLSQAVLVWVSDHADLGYGKTTSTGGHCYGPSHSSGSCSLIVAGGLGHWCQPLSIDIPFASLSLPGYGHGRHGEETTCAVRGCDSRHHRRAGHLTQGRFGAELVAGDDYLLKLSRYIHLNPVFVQGMRNRTLEDRIRHLREYRWSGYAGYAGLTKSRRDGQ